MFSATHILPVASPPPCPDFFAYLHDDGALALALHMLRLQAVRCSLETRQTCNEYQIVFLEIILYLRVYKQHEASLPVHSLARDVAGVLQE